MVTIPTPEPKGQPIGSVEVQPANTPFMSVRPADTSALGRDLSRAGDVVNNLATGLIAAHNEKNIRDAELEIFEWEKQWLDPNTGMATRMAGDAAGMTSQVSGSFSDLRKRIEDKYGSGIGASGKKAMNDLLDGKERSWYKLAAGHETAQLETDRQRQHEAAVGDLSDIAAYRMFYGDVEGAAAAVNQIGYRAEEEGARLGYDGEELDRYVESAKTNAWLTGITGLANKGDYIQAEEQLKTLLDAGVLTEKEAIATLNQITPKAEEQRDKIAAGAAYQRATIDAPAGSGPGGTATVDSVMDSLIMQESGYGPQFGSSRSLETATTIASRAGAVGTTQIMPETMRNPGMGVRPYRYADGVPPGTPVEAVAEEQRRFGRDYLQALVDRYDGNMEHALYAYNWGAGNVDAWIKTGKGAKGQAMPAETAAYAPAVLRRAGYSVSNSRRDGTGGNVVTDTMSVRDRLAMERPGAVDYFDRQVAEARARQTAAKNETYDAVVPAVHAMYNQQGSVDLEQIFAANPGLREALGDKVKPLQEWVDKLNKGEPVETDSGYYGSLMTMKVEDPDAFMKLNLNDPQVLANISPTHIRSISMDQATMRGESIEINIGVDQNGSPIKHAVHMPTVDQRAKLAQGILDARFNQTDERDVAEQQVREFIVDYMGAHEGEGPSVSQIMDFARTIDTGAFTTNPLGTAKKDASTYTKALKVIGETNFYLQGSWAETPVDFTFPTTTGTTDVMLTGEQRKEIHRKLVYRLNREPRPSEIYVELLKRYSNVFD